MAMTLVGVFDSTAEAREACRKLQAVGIDGQSVRLTTGESSPVVAEPSMPSMAQGMGAVRGFFAALFGQDGDAHGRAGHYSEAVRRGSAVVTVSATDDAQADTVAELLENCGAIDIDERIEQWRADGYRSHDPQAAAYTDEERSAERSRRMTPMAEHLRDDPLGPGPGGAAARSAYSGPERRRQGGATPAGLERRTGP